jgi:hypothetical protein
LGEGLATKLGPLPHHAEGVKEIAGDLPLPDHHHPFSIFHFPFEIFHFTFTNFDRTRNARVISTK